MTRNISHSNLITLLITTLFISIPTFSLAKVTEQGVSSFRKSVNNILSNPCLRKNNYGIKIYSLDRGETLYEVRHWMHKRDPVKYWEMWHAKNDNGQKYKRDHKFRMLGFVYSQLKIKNTESQHQRGIYFSHLYANEISWHITKWHCKKYFTANVL